MSRREQLVVYRQSPEPRVEATYDGHEMASNIRLRRLFAPKQLSLTKRAVWRYQLEPTNSGFDTATTTATVKHAAQGGTLVQEWAAVELFYEAPTGSTVEARVHDGSGNEFYWDGGSWSAAGAGDWNTPADVEANFSSLDPAVVEKVGIEWRLQTSDKTVTPFVFGAYIAARLVFNRVWSESLDPVDRGADSWDDDAINCVLLPWLRMATPEYSDQITLGAETSALDYSAGVGDSTQSVASVQAVYDLDADPRMRSPLAGSWDAVAKTFTFTTPVAANTTISVRMELELRALFQGSQHLLLDVLPHLLIESMTRDAGRGRAGRLHVRDKVNLDSISVRAPREVTFSGTLLAQADRFTTAAEVYQAVDRLTDDAGGAVVISPCTGFASSIRISPIKRPGRGDQEIDAAARFDFSLTTLQYHGSEGTEKLVDEDGFQASFVADSGA